MKNYLIHVGVDVSKLKLDVNILQVGDQKKSNHLIIENNKKSVKKFISLLKKNYSLDTILFCCENTGVYTNHLSSCCLEKGVDCWVVSALEIHRSTGILRRIQKNLLNSSFCIIFLR